MHPAAFPWDSLARDCQIARTRGSGPGGQHRNKVETAIVITHLPSGLRGEASERRSQTENLAVAKQRLRVEMALALRSEASPRDAVPSELWRGRIRGGKLSVNPEHDDFPALLAEALDALSSHVWDAAPTAKALGISSSQLVKFLKLDARAMAQLNAVRLSRGEHPLK